MKEISLPYGDTSFKLDAAGLNIRFIVEPNSHDLPRRTSEEAIIDALAHPIDSPPLQDLIRPGEKVCLLVPDITRTWEAPWVSTPILANTLNKAEIPDSDIFILCACGSHRSMTQAEHEKLLGPEIVKRIRIHDHQCEKKDEMAYLGATSRKTPVWFNRRAVEADKIISVCGVVYHFLAGFGGGGKMLLPGIAAYETIQANHELALLPGFGSGYNPEVRSGNYTDSNPFHADIFEAASFLPPVFSLNVVADNAFHIIKAFAGDWRKAHAKACNLVASMQGVAIPDLADVVIASAGGAPKDINLYQGAKLLANALNAARKDALLILLAQFPEGFGNDDTRRMLCDYKTMAEREKALREKFSIGAFSGYYWAKAAEERELILVTEMEQEDFASSGIRVAKTLDEAIAAAGARINEDCVIMPLGANTLPIMKK